MKRHYWPVGLCGLFPPEFDCPGAFQFSYLALVAGIGIAILKYRLYDVDVVIRRTLIYGLLITLLIIIYAMDVVLAQSILLHLTNSPQPELTIVVSTMAVALIFSPVRSMTRRIVDRRFYRRKYDARQVLSSFGTNVHNQVKIDDILDE